MVENQSLDTLVDVCTSTSIGGEFSLSNRVTVKVVVNNHQSFLLGHHQPFVLHLNLSAVAPVNQPKVDTFKGIYFCPSLSLFIALLRHSFLRHSLLRH